MVYHSADIRGQKCCHANICLLQAVLTENVFARCHDSTLTFHGDTVQRKLQS